jgi:hypothetical protein
LIIEYKILQHPFMKYIFLLFGVFPVIFQAQSVELTIKDFETKQIIPKAKVIANRKPIAVANLEGKINLPLNLKIVEVSAMGYDTTEVFLGGEKQQVFLYRKDKKTKEVVIRVKIDAFANLLIRDMINRFEENKPEKLPSFQLNIYSKFVLDAIADTLAKKSKDSVEDKELLDFAKHSKLFVWEKASVIKHDVYYGDKKILLTSTMSGFKQPIYELLAMSLDDINIMPNLFKNETYKDYYFNTGDSFLLNGRKTYEITFISMKKYRTKRSRNGFVYIDSVTKSLMHYQGTRKEGFTEIVNQLIENKCFTKHITYLLTNSMFQVSGANSLTSFKLKVENIETPKSFIKSDFQGNVNEISASLNDKNSIVILNKLRGNDTLDGREQNTYISMDSIIKKQNIDKKLRLFLAVTKGYFKLGKVNLNILDLAQVNRYEGFRVQIGGMTNHEFHPKYSLNGYMAYGFKDERFKGGLGVQYKLNYYQNTILSLNYQNDVLPIGRSQNDLALFKDRHDYLLQLIYFSNYYQTQNIKLGFQTDLNRNLEQKTYVQFSDISIKFPYQYDGQLIENTSVLTTGVQFRYYPKSEYITTPEGKFAVKEKPTQFLFNYAFHYPTNKNIPSYHNLSVDMTSSIKSKLGKTNLYAGLGTTIVEAPILSLFEGRGSSPTQDILYKSFGVSSMKYFTTMEPNTFYSNHSGSISIQHNFPSFRISAEKRLYFGLTYKAILGSLQGLEKHSIALQAPSKIYQEIGLEWNKIYQIIGIGIYSRIGTYHAGNIENNIAGRITLKL